MIGQAQEKLRTEMSKENNPYVRIVGEFLLQQIDGNEEAAKAILDGDKSIIKSLDAMKKEASKKKVGSCAVLTDSEGFTIVLKYFGIGIKTTTSKVVSMSSYKKAPEENDKGFDVNLDDLF